MPAFMRCAYRCDKEPTNWKGDESREKLAQVNIILKKLLVNIYDEISQIS